MVNEMLNRIIILAALLVAGFSGAGAQEPMDCIPPEDEMAGLDVGFIVAGLALSCGNVALIAHNSSRLKEGDPSGGGGMSGIMFGTLGVLYGAAIIFSDEPAVSYAGAGCAVVGAISFYYGFKSTGASNRKYDEEHGMVIDPVLIDDGTGKLGPGVQVSFTF
jgi:hypothetical protein